MSVIPDLVLSVCLFKSNNQGHNEDMNTLPHDPMWPRAGAWPAFEGTAAEKYDAVLVGVPTHKTSISRTNAQETPAAVREAIRRYSDHYLPRQRADEYATQTGQVLSDFLNLADAGDLNDPDVHEDDAIHELAQIAERSKLVLALGGDNALTYPVASAVLGRSRDTAGIITLDAHHDLREGISNGSPIRRLVDAGFPGERIVQIGIQDFTNSRAYRERANEYGITVISRDEVESRPLTEITARALEIAGRAGGPIHVDVDVDVCDRAVAPGCPASVPGGISAYQLRKLVKLLAKGFRVRSFDFAEVDATVDAPDGRTVRLVALSVLEALAGFASR